MERFFDLIIVGAGPAGLLAALGAKQVSPDLKVAIIEKNLGSPSLPNHKIGEALLTGTLLALQEAGVIDRIAQEGFHRKVGATYIWGETRQPWYVSYPLMDNAETKDYPAAFKDADRRYAIHVPRHIFENALKEEAAARGVEIIEDFVSFKLAKGQDISPAIPSSTIDFSDAPDLMQATQALPVDAIKFTDAPATPGFPEENWVVLGLEGRKAAYRAKYFIDASGQAAVLAKNNDLRIPVGHSRVGRFAYLRDIDWAQATQNGFDIHRTNIIASENGWMWVIHLGEKGHNLTSVGFIAPPAVARQLTFRNVTENYPDLKMFGVNNFVPLDILGHPMDEWYVQPDFSFKSKVLHGRNWALAGDAAMFIDPILSQGVTLAAHYGLQRGRAAALALQGNSTLQAKVSHHYQNEGAVLLEVVGQWYGNNAAVSNWKLKADILSKKHFNEDRGGPDKAFQYLTNLENLRKEYGPYPEAEQQIVNKHLSGSPALPINPLTNLPGNPGHS